MNDKRVNIEVIAPTIEEAISKGLEKLGSSQEEVDVEILDEGNKGLFGLGSRQARVRLSQKSKTLEPEKKTNDLQITPTVEDVENTNQGEDPLLKIARETVSELIAKMNIDADVTTEFGESDDDQRRPPIYIDIHGNDLSILIGRKAETLDAIQFITRLILGKEMERSIPIIVDVEGYRKRREQQIRQLASRVADQVVETGRSQALEPMLPNERRFVHIELRHNPSVFTESTGEGSHRKVVIYPKD